MPGDDLLTLPEIAEMTGMAGPTVRVWVKQGRLPATKVGRQWMVRRADLERMLAEDPRIGRPRPRRGDAIASEPELDPDERRPAFDIARVLSAPPGRRSRA
jgi:excisionase family DNA binding protein